MFLMVKRGLSDESGSWKITCRSRRTAFISRAGNAARSSQPAASRYSSSSSVLSSTRPPSGSTSREMLRTTVVLPQPLSPASARVSSLPTSKLTPSTARTSATLRFSRPAVTG